MTNETDLNECCAQIKLIRQLTTQPETFDLDKVLIELETKKKLLMKYRTANYQTILKGLESGELIHPEDWVKEEVPEEPKIDERAIALEKTREVKIAKLKADLKELETPEV